jgi:coenzyme F420-reducing hydrogenase delta subunit
MAEPRVIVFTCNWNAYTSLEAAGNGHLAYPATVRPIMIPCLGRIDPGLILKAFEKGATGVLLLGCTPGECYYQSGDKVALEVFKEVRAMVHLLGYRETQLRMEWVAAGDGEAFVAIVRDFILELDERQDP